MGILPRKGSIPMIPLKEIKKKKNNTIFILPAVSFDTYFEINVTSIIQELAKNNKTTR